MEKRQKTYSKIAKILKITEDKFYYIGLPESFYECRKITAEREKTLKVEQKLNKEKFDQKIQKVASWV